MVANKSGADPGGSCAVVELGNVIESGPLRTIELLKEQCHNRPIEGFKTRNQDDCLWGAILLLGSEIEKLQAIIKSLSEDQ